MHTYAASRLPAIPTVLRKCHVVHFIVVLGCSSIALQSRISSTIGEAIMHYIPSLSCILHAANLIMSIIICVQLIVKLGIVLIRATIIAAIVHAL